MNYDEMSDEEFNNLTPEEHTKYLIESYKNIRKIEILEKLPLIKWTKDELLDMLINFDLLKAAGSLKAISIDEFIKSGEYKDLEIDFEEYKIIEETEEMQNIFMYDIKKLRPCAILKDLPFAEWTRLELLDLLMEYNTYILSAKAVNRDIKKISPIMVYTGIKYTGIGRNHLKHIIKKL